VACLLPILPFLPFLPVLPVLPFPPAFAAALFQDSVNTSPMISSSMLAKCTSVEPARPHAPAAGLNASG
jgi:hypothetical protein